MRLKSFSARPKHNLGWCSSGKKIYVKYPDSDAMLKDAWMMEEANAYASIN